MRILLPCLLTLLCLPILASAISNGQVDDFEDGTTMGWAEGLASPNPPANIADGGPLGLGDNYLRNVSSGGIGAGSRMAMFNLEQWTGNYLTAGVDAIRVDFENSGSNELTLRLGLEGGQLGTRFVTVQGFTIPPDRAWHQVTFDLGSLTRVAGSETADAVLAKVTGFRIMSAVAATWQGDVVAATLCVDNITALSGGVPVRPASWGATKARYGRRSPRP